MDMVILIIIEAICISFILIGMCEILYQRQKHKVMKKAISIILFIILARVCDGQSINVPSQTLNKPAGTIVLDTANMFTVYPFFWKDSATGNISPLYNVNHHGLQIFQDRDSGYHILMDLSSGVGLGLTKQQAISKTVNR